jgi:sensor histidine kinase YesM
MGLLLLYFAVGVQLSFQRGIYMSLLFIAMQFLVYTANNRFLIPSFFEKEKKKFYFINIIFLFATVSFFTTVDIAINKLFFLPENRPSLIIFPFFLHSVLCVVALWASIGQYLTEKEKKTKIEIEELKREKAESELRFLKAQINPHFLLNALNNIYTMTYMGDKSAHEKIATLSDMLRYVLYDCESDLIPLNKEVEYIRSYIEFQQLKTERKQNITFLYNKEDENYMIAPMLLIPFIENGFKHSGIEKDRSGFVSILLSQTKEKLLFNVKNSRSGEKIPVKPPKDKGIGIENVKNRLELLYPGKYLLDVRADNHEYSIYLELFSNESKREI